MNSDSNQIIKTMSWGVFWRILRYPILLASLLVIPKIMGDVVYGRFAVFLSVYMMSESFTGMGNLQIFGRFLPEHGDDEHQRSSLFLHGMLLYGFLIALIVAVVAAITVYNLRGSDFPLRWIVLLVLILLLGKLQGTLFAFVYGRNQIGRFSSRALIRSISKFVFVAVLYLLFGLDGALWAFVLNELILVCISAYWSREHLFSHWSFPALKNFLPYLKFGLYFYIPILLLGLLQRSGNVLIKAMTRGSREHVYSQVAHFDLANQFLLLTVSFFAIFLVTLVPSLTKLHLSEQHDRIRNWLALVLTYCGLLGLLAIDTLVCFGRDVIGLIGPGFGGTYANALIMSAAIFPLIIAHVGTNVCVVEKRPRINIAATLGGLATMLLLFFLLVPDYGAIGASWSSVGGYLVYAAIFVVHFRGLFTQTLGKMLIVAGVGLLSIPAYLNVPPMPAGALCYPAICLLQLLLLRLLGVIDLEHFRRLMAAFKSTRAAAVSVGD